MAGCNREDWEDIKITKEEYENLTQALKKEEFRKLLNEYAEEITDPKNRQIYQDEIVQLEAERGIDCTFVNPEPGFVVKTSVNGEKKAFVNICKNKAIGKPSCKKEYKDNTRGLSWSIPLSQSPGREDLDKKRNRCVVYDVVFHPDTLTLAEKNGKFKKLVIDTALNAIEDSYKVKLDKKNIKFPKIDFKGFPVASVIRKKSRNQPTLTEEEIEFQNTIKYPFKPPKESKPIVKNFENKKEDVGKYTIPKYVIKHRSDVDLQEFTYDKNAKINAAIPKQLVIEVNLPMLNSTNTVTLDVMEKSLHLKCDKPAKYKLDIQLPYSVNEEIGNAKFDKDKRLLIITLPVLKAKMSVRDLMREDSGVESDSSPVGSISNNELDDENISNSLEESFPYIKEEEDVHQEDFKLSSEESEDEKSQRTKDEVECFLDSDKHYLLPSYTCSIDEDKICFVLNVKNVDPNSVIKKTLNSHACHIKFLSIGSGFFPVYYAFLVDFKNECSIDSVHCDAWDNNITVLIEVVNNDGEITKYYAGLDEDSLTENYLSSPLRLKKMMEELVLESKEQEEEEETENDGQLNVNVESANVDEVVISIIPEESESLDEKNENEITESSNTDTSKNIKIGKEKCRTFSDSGFEEIASSPLARKSILKKRINRSLSESNADDYMLSSSVDKISEGSDLCLNEGHDEVPCIKKTVRFNDKIRQQLFRVNSSILGQKKKNKKKSKNKRKAVERRLSESENSEQEDKEGDKKTKKLNKSMKKSLIEVVSNRKKNENCDVPEAVTAEKKEKPSENEDKPKYGLKKSDKIFEFKSDLIFDLDM